jgi:hypothetical protein
MDHAHKVGYLKESYCPARFWCQQIGLDFFKNIPSFASCKSTAGPGDNVYVTVLVPVASYPLAVKLILLKLTPVRLLKASSIRRTVE